MRQIGIEKVTLNMGVGAPGENLEKAKKLLGNITGLKPVETKSKRRIPTWKLRLGLPIACKVTVRGKKAEELLKRLLQAVNNRLKSSKFDVQGNFSFGIKEYLEIPGMEYDMSIGIIGLEAAVTLKRPGFRIKLRRIKRKKIPSRHKISKEEAMEYLKKEFNVEIR